MHDCLLVTNNHDGSYHKVGSSDQSNYASEVLLNYQQGYAAQAEPLNRTSLASRLSDETAQERLYFVLALLVLLPLIKLEGDHVLNLPPAPSPPSKPKPTPLRFHRDQKWI